MYGYIYLTTNTVDGKIYVGQHKASSFEAWYKGSGIHVKNAIRKYGTDKFTVRLLDFASSKEELNKKEIYWVKELDARNPAVGYNIARGGAGHQMSRDSRQRMSEARKRYCSTEVGRLQLSKSMKGKKMPEETKKKISDAMKGKVKSEQTRKRLSESLKGNRCGFCSPDYKHKKVSEETKKKLSEAHRGKVQSEETRKRRAETMKEIWRGRKAEKFE